MCAALPPRLAVESGRGRHPPGIDAMTMVIWRVSWTVGRGIASTFYICFSSACTASAMATVAFVANRMV